MMRNLTTGYRSKHIIFMGLGIFLLVFGFYKTTEAKDIILSEKSRISIITCSPGTQVYTYFGHSAIRVVDPSQGIDIIYNYGLFDFNTPNFYSKFIRGKLNYMLGTQKYLAFQREYISSNRSFFEQVLNFDLQQKQALSNYLAKNHLPENRYYLYDFFLDNCSTRIRDAIIKSSSNHYSVIFKQRKNNKTFRQLIDPYIQIDPWLDFGIDLALGLPADRIAKPDETMFLPDGLMEAFKEAAQKNESGVSALISQEIPLFKSQEPFEQNTPFFTPKLTFWTLFFLTVLLTILGYKKGWKFMWLDLILFGMVGIFGLFLLFLWFGTDHKVTAGNLNILWANPLPILALIFLIRKWYLKPIKGYFVTSGILMISIIIARGFIPQELHDAIIPVLLTLSLRFFYIGFSK